MAVMAIKYDLVLLLEQVATRLVFVLLGVTADRTSEGVRFWILTGEPFQSRRQ